MDGGEGRTSNGQGAESPFAPSDNECLFAERDEYELNKTFLFSPQQ